jgi:Cu2+-exporting ATPase
MEVGPDDDGGPVYCCHGCELAAEIISGAGLDAWYAEREAPAPRPGEAQARGWEQVPREDLGDGTQRATLCIDGLACASCTWVTEEVMKRVPGVAEARVSYATGRAEVQWDPEKTDLDAVLSRVQALGYRPRAVAEAARDDTTRDLLVRLGVAVFSAMNVMMFSVSVYLGWFAGMDEGFSALFRWVNLALATPVALWSAAPYFRGAWNGLKAGVLHMDLPISLGVAVLYGHGLISTVFLQQEGYLDSLCMLVALLLAGRLIDHRGRRRTAEAATALAAQAPRVARRRVGENDEHTEIVQPAALVRGDRIEVAAGEEVAADGVVAEGEGSVEMSLLTGESEPARVQPGDKVVAGAVLQDGALVVRVEAAGSDTLLARMAEGLREATDRPVEARPSDRLAPWFTGIVLAIAALTLAGWWALTGLGPALEATIAVLVVACPCALSLARPLATAAGLGAAARRGLLFRSGDALHRLAEVDTVVLDKTGTVTGGHPVVVEADDAVLRIAAGIERSSIHPVARAIVAEAIRRGIPIPRSEGVQEVAGQGIRGWVDGVCWTIQRGQTPGTVEVVGAGTITLRDTLRPDAARTLAALQQQGVEVTLLTGDHAVVARRIARAAGIDRVVAEVTPEDKAAWIRDARASGRTVLFVGDGLNDGPALAEADVGLAMGSGAASSVLASDAVVAAESVRPVLAGILAARTAAEATAKNLRRSILYNIVAVSGAVLGLVNPLVAAVLMPLSSALVLAGALAVERRVKAELAATPDDARSPS